MENKDLPNQEEEKNTEFETEILRNDDISSNDSTVVIDEEDRTVMLTEDETIIIEKEEPIDIPPSNRPRKVYAGMWGVPEIITVGLATFAVLSIILVYLFFVLPAKEELEENRAKRDALEGELITARAKFGDTKSTETQVAKFINSANDFETRFLKPEMTGKTAIYQRLNGLISAYGLTNTTGPDYVPLEISEDERRRATETEGQRGRSKFQSLFPGVYITMTVEGSYFNLRRFIQEVEKSKEFIVVSTIELEPAEDNDEEKENTITVSKINANGETVQVQQKVPKRGKTRGKVVSLRLEMAAYFQRPADQRANTAPIDPESLENLKNSDEPIVVTP